MLVVLVFLTLSIVSGSDVDLLFFIGPEEEINLGGYVARDLEEGENLSLGLKYKDFETDLYSDPAFHTLHIKGVFSGQVLLETRPNYDLYNVGLNESSFIDFNHDFVPDVKVTLLGLVGDSVALGLVGVPVVLPTDTGGEVLEEGDVGWESMPLTLEETIRANLFFLVVMGLAIVLILVFFVLAIVGGRNN